MFQAPTSSPERRMGGTATRRGDRLLVLCMLRCCRASRVVQPVRVGVAKSRAQSIAWSSSTGSPQRLGANRR